MRRFLPTLTPARIWLLALLVLLLAALAGYAPAAAAKPSSAADKTSYVALGDSFTAGPVIPVQIPPYGCLKSDHNYPHLAAPDLGPPTFRDASCSGAKTDHMTQSQNVEGEDPPPQFSALDKRTQIVTVGIGGNDIGFSEIVENCTSTSPDGHPCQDTYVQNGQDEISNRIAKTAPKIAAVLQGIHTRSPRAQVYLVNYLPIFPEEEADEGPPGCWPDVPVAHDDVSYLRAKQNELNKMLAGEAATNDATVVDAYSAGVGHDACQAPHVRWVEPAVPVAAAPLHPNLSGMQGTADELKATIPAN